MKKRQIDIAVVSDVHLGTPQCHAEELLAYLSSIRPSRLILNGDVLSVPDLKNEYFPPSHLKVIKKVLSMAASGTAVYYICGDRDARLGNFNRLTLGTVQVCDSLLLELDGRQAWFFHGDGFDTPFFKPGWMAAPGRPGHTLLRLLNRATDRLRSQGRQAWKPHSLGPGPTSPKGPQRIAAFERNVASAAIQKGVDAVVCSHVCLPGKHWVETRLGKTLYLNSGDWVQHLTALEYTFKRWKIYRYNEDKLSAFFADEDLKEMDMGDLMDAIGIRTREPDPMPKKKASGA